MALAYTILLAVLGLTSARMAYKFSDGYLDVLGSEPEEVFDCDGRPYGYYADVASGCRVFHICLPLHDDKGEVYATDHYSFFCGNQTVFSQDSLTCSHPHEALPCDEAEGFYDVSNGEFGRIPEERSDADLGRSLDDVNDDLERSLDEIEDGLKKKIPPKTKVRLPLDENTDAPAPIDEVAELEFGKSLDEANKEVEQEAAGGVPAELGLSLDELSDADIERSFNFESNFI